MQAKPALSSQHPQKTAEKTCHKPQQPQNSFAGLIFAEYFSDFSGNERLSCKNSHAQSRRNPELNRYLRELNLLDSVAPLRSNPEF